MELVPAMEENRIAFWRTFMRLMPVEFHNDPEAVWIISDFYSTLTNRVLYANIVSENPDTYIEKTITHYKQKGVPFIWIVGPTSRPKDLETHLLAHGFADEDSDPGMAIDLFNMNNALSIPTGFTFAHVQDNTTQLTFARVANAGFAVPENMARILMDGITNVDISANQPIENYIGYLHEEPVAVASLCCAAGLAGIYNVTTLPNMRGQGLGTALTSALLHEARQMGYRVGILQSTAMGLHVYERLGFQEVCRIHFYSYEQKS